LSGDTDEIACIQDCAGIWGGDAEIIIMYIDLDGDGLGSGPEIEFCDLYMPDGDLFVDNADDLEPNCETNDTDDCGICGGEQDDGDEDGDGDDCEIDCPDGNEPDCNNDCGGSAVVDECGVCDTDTTNDCVPDCTDNETDCGLSGGLWDGIYCWGGAGEIDLFGACCTGSSCIMNGCDLSDSTVYLTETSMAFNSSKEIKQIKLTMEGSVISGSPLLGAAGTAGFFWIVDPDGNWVVGQSFTGTTIPAGSCGTLFEIDYLNDPVYISVEIEDENMN
jgi:hypothetical protein